jgi:hypothetical protein
MPQQMSPAPRFNGAQKRLARNVAELVTKIIDEIQKTKKGKSTKKSKEAERSSK